MKMSKDEVYFLFLSMVKNREKIVRTIVGDLDECARASKGCQYVLDNWDRVEGSPENQLKQLRAMVETNRRLTSAMERLILVVLAYILSPDFQANAAQAASKLAPPGRESEPLQEMFQSKMRGG